MDFLKNANKNIQKCKLSVKTIIKSFYQKNIYTHSDFVDYANFYLFL